MTDEQFETLAKGLASQVSRRQAIRAFAAAGAGAMLSAVGIGSVVAPTCREPGRPCRSGSQCCTGACDRATGRCIWL